MVSKEKWHSLTLAQQLGNIGSEIARARIAQEQGDSTNRDNALIRGLALVDLTLGDARRQHQLKEIARLREVLADWLCGTGYYQIIPSGLEEYCIQFLSYRDSTSLHSM